MPVYDWNNAVYVKATRLFKKDGEVSINIKRCLNFETALVHIKSCLRDYTLVDDPYVVARGVNIDDRYHGMFGSDIIINYTTKEDYEHWKEMVDLHYKTGQPLVMHYKNY